MLTHEIEARKRLHDHVMEDSDRRRVELELEKPNQLANSAVRLRYAFTRARSSAKFVA